MNRLSKKKKKIIEPIHRLHGYHFNIEVNEKKIVKCKVANILIPYMKDDGLVSEER